MLEHLIDLLRDLYDQYGYLIVFLGALGENTALLGLALPGGTLALLGAFYARQGTLDLAWVIFFAWMGTVLGYHADYLLGRFALGKVMLRWGDSRLGRRMRLAGRLRLGRRLLAKYGGRAILLSHIVGHIRSFVALSAGATRMSYRRFLSFELVAALLWNTAFCLIGYLAGAEYDRILTIVERAGWIIAGVVVLAILVWKVALPWLRKRRHATRHHVAPGKSTD
ncbi:MAG TPA: DedA family protein [Ktedonobacterales bacterium]|jgi:membrane protein DedA with SNARE-associated domain